MGMNGSPLVGPGNVSSPPVGIEQRRIALPVPAGVPGLPDIPLGVGAQGGNQISPIGILVDGMSDVRPPLMPGVPTNRPG